MGLVRLLALTAASALLAGACSGSVATTAGDGDGDVRSGAGRPAPAEEALIAMPAVDPLDPSPRGAAPADRSPVAAALIDADGQLGLVADDGTVGDTWFKWDARPSPDRSVAVLTLGPEVGDIGPERPVTWVSLPEGDAVAEHRMSSESELTATSLDGTFAGFTTRAGEAPEHAIAGPRRTSTIEIMSRADGVVFTQELDGNFVPEAFSRRVVDGVPSQVFLLEYFPAEAPAFYRVRVLSTATGEVSLPLNLRDKQQQVDERMAGFSRSQVVAHEQGLLFTLYRGTIDGTPDGQPYAFVHTLDFADGVWCLDVDPSLELDRLPGRLAAAGDRLYVASANGRVGSFPIPSITDPDLSPTMDWVVQVTREADGPPAMLADADGVWIGPDDGASRLVRLGADGRRGDPLGLPGSEATALALDGGGLVQAIGADWSTFDLVARPGWLDEIEVLVIG